MSAGQVRVYLADGEEGPTDLIDVTPAQAQALTAASLCYAPDDDPEALWTYIGKADATWQRLMEWGYGT